MVFVLLCLISLDIMPCKSIHPLLDIPFANVFSHFVHGLFILFFCFLYWVKAFVFGSVTQSCPTLCNPMDSRMSGFPVLHYLPEFAQTQVHWVDNGIQSPHPLLPSSPPALRLSQHQGLFQWVGSSHQVAKVLELQHQSSQWIFRADFH